ncbi:hypothetical protein MTOK_30790 [Mycolicibacterium tokaiense]|nr:hypothetical protein MTOK_30790 [Mycolicibacterium tokaiense]
MFGGGGGGGAGSAAATDDEPANAAPAQQAAIRTLLSTLLTLEVRRRTRSVLPAWNEFAAEPEDAASKAQENARIAE